MSKISRADIEVSVEKKTSGLTLLFGILLVNHDNAHFAYQNCRCNTERCLMNLCQANSFVRMLNYNRVEQRVSWWPPEARKCNFVAPAQKPCKKPVEMTEAR